MKHSQRSIVLEMLGNTPENEELVYHILRGDVTSNQQGQALSGVLIDNGQYPEGPAVLSL